MHGEKASEHIEEVGLRGSPPLVRGKGSRRRRVASSPRITPACAGKRYKFPQWYHLNGDHPRLCGEKNGLFLQRNGKQGSPPACAGKSSLIFSSVKYGGDHPRLRGEKPRTHCGYAEVSGSPPLARGKVNHILFHDGLNRITPACAGKSFIGRSCLSGMKDHPRLRGEKGIST